MALPTRTTTSRTSTTADPPVFSDYQRQPVAPGERLSLVVAGHVDHGKSTVIGRLLVDTGSLPEGKLELVRAVCERNAKPFEYAFLIDALKDEQAQGITIDAARVFFTTARRQYEIIDAPGHIEFLKNMVTGAARAEAALLVIDAREGVRENSRRHGYLLSMLGVRQIAVVLNKMDLVGHQELTFVRIRDEYLEFLQQIGVSPAHVIPVSAFNGDNVAARSGAMPWYAGPTILEALDGFVADEPRVRQPFRMPVQGVYKLTGQGDDRRIVAGSVESGRLEVGDEVVFYPSGKRSRVRTIEGFNQPPRRSVHAEQAVGFTLEEQVYVTRGEVAARLEDSPPLVAARVRAHLFWLGRQPLATGKEYVLKLGTARIPMYVESIHRVIDASRLACVEGREHVDRNEVAECTLTLGRELAFDRAEDAEATSRFVIVDEFNIAGGGVIRDAVPDGQSSLRHTVLRRNLNWAVSRVGPVRRAERLAQKPMLLLITGERRMDRKRFGRDLEARLFDEGRHVYFLAMNNLLYGVDADLSRTDADRSEHVRRLGEVANILLDAGLIVIATAVALTARELQLFRTTVGHDRMAAVWIGEPLGTDVKPDLLIGEHEEPGEATSRLKTLLQGMGVIFKPW